LFLLKAKQNRAPRQGGKDGKIEKENLQAHRLRLRRGRIEEAGNRDTILQSSTNAYTRSLLESVPTLGGVRYV